MITAHSPLIAQMSKQWNLHSNILPLLDAGQAYDFNHPPPPPAAIEGAGTSSDRALPSSSGENGSEFDSSDSDDDGAHLPVDPLPPGITLHPSLDLTDTHLARLAILDPGNQRQGLRPYIVCAILLSSTTSSAH